MTQVKKNLFIAFEGLDGSGKSTQVALLKRRLEKNGHRVFCTAEPTHGPIGKIIRDIFNHRICADHKTIAALFLADRIEHIENAEHGLIKKLNDGYTVITDRYYFSSYAYQGAHVPLEWVIQINEVCANLLKPDAHIFLDIDPEKCMERMHASRPSLELFETLQNQMLVKAKYLEAISLLWEEERIFRCDGARPAQDIAGDVWNFLSDMH